MVTLDGIAVFDLADATDIEPNRSIELQGITTGGGLRITEHHTDLLTKLVDEDNGGVGLIDRSGHLTQRLTHQTCLQTHFVITHFTVDLCFRRQSRNGVNDDQVYGSRTNQLVCYLQGLLTAIRLRDQEVLYVHT